MYKCSECGNEYDIMPKFCDCGNDIFITVEDEILHEVDDTEDKITQSRSRRNLRRKTFSPVSVIVFVFCIILSLLVLFVIGNPKKNNKDITVKTAQNEKIEIPSIDTFWDSTPPKNAIKVQPEEENIVDKIVEQIIPQPVKEVNAEAPVSNSPAEIPQKATPVIPKQIQTVSVPKVVQPQKQTVSTTVAKTQPQIQNQTKPQNQSKPQNQTTNQQPITFGDLTNKIRSQYYSNQNNNTQQNTNTSQAQNASPTSATPQTTAKQYQPVTQTQTATKTTQVQNPIPLAQTTTQVVAPVIPAKSEAQLKRELATYKSGLRNTIGKKIDFTRVIGDGECSLTFKLDSNGRLTSKAFSKQSSNITLNDAAFYALNTTISYNPPPEGYKGETLKLSIKFYNGNFEIMLN